MKFLSILAVLQVAGFAFAAAEFPTDKTLVTTQHTNEIKAWKPVVPGANDGHIAKATSLVLSRFHYLAKQQPIDDTVASKFLDKYLDSLDPGHLVFIQSDLQEFEKWRTRLDEMTARSGDTSPAEMIFNRFLERFTEQVDYVTNLLGTETFDFKGNDRFTPNRKDLPRPDNLVEAKKIWRDRVRFEYLQEKLNKTKTEEITGLLVKRYARQLRMLREFDSDDILQYYLTALTHVYDPHSDYMSKSTMENFEIGMKLSLFGIGALLSSPDGYCQIQELMEGPAKKSGQIKPNDKIVAVAQGTNPPVDVVEWKLNKVVELIRGPKGTEVRLTVIPVDAPDPSTRKVVSLIRDEIKLEDQEAKAKLIELPGSESEKPQRIGIIDLPSFYADMKNRDAGRKSTTSDVAKLLQKLKEEKVSGLILDLRRNGGGSLEEAINLTGLFIKEGPVVQVQDSVGEINVDKDTDPSILYDGPLVVLTSRFSASASEIVAGALQDYGRALVVGDSSTHGKGTVQTLLELKNLLQTTNNLGALKITIRKFYRASGSSTQLKGVIPDIILPSVNNHADVGEVSLQHAMAWDTISAAKYEAVNLIPPLLPELRKRSEARVASDKDFAYIREEIDRYKKAKEEKTFSLNEEQRLKERKENEARVEARNKELRERPEPNYKTYDLTLKNASLPGLPPPTNSLAFANRKMHAGLDAKVPNKMTLPPEKNSGKLAGTNASDGVVISTNGLSKSVTETLTNGVAKVTKLGDDDEEKEDSSVPSIDVTLDEGRRILQDLIALSSKDASLAAGRP